MYAKRAFVVPHKEEQEGARRQMSLTLLALNPHRVSRDQPSCCRQFRRNGLGLEYRP